MHASNAGASPAWRTGLVTVVDPTTGEEVRAGTLVSPDVEALPSLGLVVDQGTEIALDHALHRTVYLHGTALDVSDGIVAGKWRITVVTRPSDVPAGDGALVIEALKLLGLRQVVSTATGVIDASSFLGDDVRSDRFEDFLDFSGAPDVGAVVTGPCPRWTAAAVTATAVEQIEVFDGIAAPHSRKTAAEQEAAVESGMCHATLALVVTPGTPSEQARRALEHLAAHLPGAISPLASCKCRTSKRC